MNSTLSGMTMPQDQESSNVDYRHNFLMWFLFNKYKTPMVPYHDVARDYLGWKSKKTADARLNDGVVKELKLDVICPGKGTKSPAFVEVSHLTDFLLSERNVCVY